MSYRFTYVHTNQDEKVLTSKSELIVLEAIPIGGGGEVSLTEIDRRRVDIIKIELNVDGIKAFAKERILAIFGIIAQKIFLIAPIIGLIKTISKILQIALSGIPSNRIDKNLSLNGIKARNILQLQYLFGIEKFAIDEEINLRGTKNKPIELLNNIQGNKRFDLDLNYNIQGERNRDKIILALLNIE